MPHSNISRGCRSRGLTLIELLIVVGTIGVLAALLLPIMAGQRDKARRNSCQSNLKQIGLGLLQYCRDYDEKFPRYTIGQPPLVWQQAVQPYVKSVPLFACPSNPAVAEPPVNGVSGGSPAVPRSYALNPRVSYAGRQVSLADNKNPARKIMVAESRAAWADYGSPWWNGWGWGWGFAGHMGTSNFLFADGHVKAIEPTDTASPFNMWGGMDRGACGSRSINCDKPEPAIINGLRALQASATKS